MAEPDLEVLLKEEERFEPPPEFVRQANFSDPAVYDEAERDFEAWWERWAKELDWFEPWQTVLEWDAPWAKWFQEGKLNASHNCLDRHVEAGRGDKVAYHWVGEDGSTRDVTYAELLDMTKRFANVLKSLGVEKGDVVGIYMPMLPETPAAMLGCARIGATHNVVFGGFSVQSVKERMEVSDAKLLVTADANMRRGQPIAMKEQVDTILGDLPKLEHVVVVRRGGQDTPMEDGRDVWWHEACAAADAECEGAPDYPAKDRWWQIVEDYKVSILYTAPTAIRACIKWGREHPAGHDLSSLRLLGSVGEPINPRAWLWYHEVIGGGRCPIVDTWWQTETGQIMITPLPGITHTKPGSATRPFPGTEAAVVKKDGSIVDEGGGFLTLRRPWPAMARTLYKEPDRYVETYWSRWGSDVYVVGDAAKVDADGYFWIVGRTDDVINVSGHRLSTMEVESAIVSHERVAEAAVVPQPDETTGQAIAAFVTMQGGADPPDGFDSELREHVGEKIGKLARPKRFIWADDLPKTRSGKIMRRLLRNIAEGRELGDVTTLRDPAVTEM